MSTEPTAEMMTAFEHAWLNEGDPHQQDDDIRAGLRAVLGLAEPLIRAAIVADIEAALAADQADSDVTSGESIWHQTGYRHGLQAAADIAREAS